MLSQLTLYTLPTLDVRCLSAEALAKADQLFEDDEASRGCCRLMNLTGIRSASRVGSDGFLTDVLGITSDDAHAAVHRLREKLCAEPSIHGGKKSRCDLAGRGAEIRLIFGLRMC